MNSVIAKPEGFPTLAFNARLVRYQPWTFSVHFVFTLVVFGSQVVPGLILKAVFDAIADPASAAYANPGQLWNLVGLYAIMQLIVLAASLGAEWYGWTFRFVVGGLLRRNLLASILRRSGEHSLPVSPGEAVNRFRTDVGEVADFPTWLPDQAGKILAACIAVVIMARINLSITLMIFAPLALIMALTRLAWGRIIHYNRLTASSTDAVTGFLGEIFGAVQAVKIANAEEDLTAHFQRLNENRSKAALREKLFWGLLDMVNSSAVTFGIGVILLMAGAALRTGSFTVGDFALFTFYLWFTTQVPSELGTFYGDYKTQEVSIERMLDMVRPEPAERLVEAHPIYPSGPVPLPTVTEKTPLDTLERLEVRKLSYHHPGNGQGIFDIDFDLPRGTFTVITGRVGSGKSTLVRVLLGLLARDAGEIYWNGKPVLDPAAFFRPPRCAYTSQVPRLFSDSLRDNILMGLPDARVDLPGAVWLSVLEQDVAELPDGLDTLVGPRGIRLSGGQVQRAAAARMYVRRPELLVFDDLSSALDVETEKTLWNRLDWLLAGNDRGKVSSGTVENGEKEPASLPSSFTAPPATCLVVSHRRAALRRADHILVLKDGRVEDEGHLDDLLERCEEMRRIWTGEAVSQN
jgi:ATP-binding cassette, subfamily B, bacterial